MRLYRLLVTGFAAASLAFVPSWFRILEGTWPARVLACHAVALTALAVSVSRHKHPSARAAAAIAGFAVLVPAAFLMVLRMESGPAMYIHDSAVQSEEAMRFVLEGKNPYVESYAATPMADVPFFGGKNPALEHVVYYPGSFLLPLPLYVASKTLTHRYDHRLFLLVSFALALWGAWRLAEPGWRPHLLVAIGLNPAFNFYLIQGANDSLVAGLLVAAMALAAAGSHFLAGSLVGVACGSKQTAWFFAVLYVAEVAGRHGWRRAALVAVVAGAAMAALTLPYVLWDSHAFFDDTYAYLAGTARESYPASGLSIAHLMARLDVSPEVTRKLFSALQLGLVLPLLALCACRQLRAPGLSALAFRYSGVVAVSFACSRYFNASHLAFVSLFFVASFFTPATAPEKTCPRESSDSSC